MIIVKDYTLVDDPFKLYIEIPLHYTSAKNVDVYCNSLYVKVNYAPYLFELDLMHEIDPEHCTSVVGNGLVKLELQKLVPGPWPEPKFRGTAAQITNRRLAAQDQEMKRIQSQKDQKIAQKHQTERELVQKQMDVERDKRTRIEHLKSLEKLQAERALKEWADNQQQIERKDSAVVDVNQESDDDVDIDAIRSNVRNSLYNYQNIGAIRQTGHVQVEFTTRDKIPTQTARETEDEKWRLRMKLAEAMSKKNNLQVAEQGIDH
jgi:dyslexia susceptibility 1 candidate gene 1 protein